jgi:hypothetical protein
VAYQGFREHFTRAFVHVYWQFYLLPFIALAMAWPAVEAARRLLSPVWLRSGAFVIAGLYLWAMNQERILALYANTSLGLKPVQNVWQAFLGW